jgi:hypothetical protein
LNTVAQSFKALPLDSKAKFFGVSALSTAIGTYQVLRDFSRLVEWLLESLKIPTLAPHVSEFLNLLTVKLLILI